MSGLTNDLEDWLSRNANGLDESAADAAGVLSALADASRFDIGIPQTFGGSGGDVVDAIESIAAVSEHSLAAGFVFWSHRTLIEYLLQSSNTALCEKLLPDLIAGRRAGATGLSNAMKFLEGIEELQIKARADGTDESFVLNGTLPWVTNLRPQGFDVAVAVEGTGHSPAFIAVLSSEDEGLRRSSDLELMAMRATNTAALAIHDVHIGPDRILDRNAAEWLPRVRPAFLGLQCGMSIGLARRALKEATSRLGKTRGILHDPIESLSADLRDQVRLLAKGLRTGQFAERPASLFDIRIALADITAEALQLELQACGGGAYLSKRGQATQRRLREGIFIPLITPSLVQLKSALHAQVRVASGVA